MTRLISYFCLAVIFIVASSGSVGAKPEQAKGQGKPSQVQKSDKGAKKDKGPKLKHRGRDANGDGVITRAEWRGNDVSFRNHDWNGDGILSGEELRPGANK